MDIDAAFAELEALPDQEWDNDFIKKAAALLMSKFDVGEEEAREVVGYWIDTIEEWLYREYQREDEQRRWALQYEQNL